MRSEAAAEIHHMNTIHQAAKDEKNWRTAAWWIDRRDRQRSADAKWALSDVTAAIGAAIRRLLEIILAEVPDPRRRHSIVAKLLDVSGNGAEDPTQDDAKAVSAAVSVALERAAGSSVGEEQCHD
jgi:hypothetical protein